MAGAALLVAMIVAYAAAVHTENVVESHPAHADALRAGMRERGWLPDFVPAAASGIREVHNLDSGAQWIRFALPPAELDALARRMPALSPDEAGSRVRRPPRWRGGWVALPGVGDPASVHRAADQHGRSWCIVVDRHESTVYGWTCGAAS